MLQRIFNILLALIALAILIIPILVISALVRVTSRGPAIHWSKRVGRKNSLFIMPKFRTMRVNTPQLATHLLNNGSSYLTPIGAFLRKTSLDELPQIWSVLKGDMNFVGPRPALFNQDDLIELRTKSSVHTLTPGITGWAQINGRDDISIEDKVKLDIYYLKNNSLFFDIRILFLTAFQVLLRKNISH
jgi:O-antigen biosynthesis protein WbqP